MNSGGEQVFIALNDRSLCHLGDQNQPSTSTQRLNGVEMQSSFTQIINLDNVKDFSNVCRTCASVTEFIIPIFTGEGLQNNLAEKIQKYLSIKVSSSDTLPHVVCYQCASTLLACHELVQCARQADAALRQRLAAPSPQEQNPINVKPSSSTADDTQSKSLRDSHSEHDGTCDLSDDEPLATLALKNATHPYNKFYRALVNFRDHFVSETHHNVEHYPEFTDSSVSDVEGEVVENFDDLSHCNMRRGRLDEQTRSELDQAQIKINDKVYYTCKLCGKNLSSAHTYLFHKRIHTGERPCVCHVCGKQFRAPNGLQRHLTETHERVRRYSCSLCPKNFANSQNLKQHLRIHTGEKPFVCPQCGKRFTQSGSLHVHLKTHSSHFPHQCAECGAKFRLRAGLARHRLKHTGERPHACTLCARAFRHRYELSAHAHVHADSRHECGLCGAAFRQPRALRQHARRLHRAPPAAY